MGQRSCKPPLWLCRFGLQPKPKGAAGQGCAAAPPISHQGSIPANLPMGIGEGKRHRALAHEGKTAYVGPGGAGGGQPREDNAVLMLWQ